MVYKKGQTWIERQETDAVAVDERASPVYFFWTSEQEYCSSIKENWLSKFLDPFSFHSYSWTEKIGERFWESLQVM